MAFDTSVKTVCHDFPQSSAFRAPQPIKTSNGMPENIETIYSLWMDKQEAHEDDIQYQLFEESVYKISTHAFLIIMRNAYRIHCFEIVKDPIWDWLNPSSEEHPSIQSISAEIAEIAKAALEENIECHQWMYFRDYSQRFCEVVFNPDFDKSKYLCVKEEIDRIQKSQEAFNYIIKIVPQDLTSNMQELNRRASGCAARFSYRMGILTQENRLRIHDFSMKIISNLLNHFLEGADALPNELNRQVQQKQREKIVDLCDVYDLKT